MPQSAEAWPETTDGKQPALRQRVQEAGGARQTTAAAAGLPSTRPRKWNRRCTSTS